jgi:CRP-like cAMP-binding protein
MINMRLKQAVDYIQAIGNLNAGEKVFIFFIIHIMAENDTDFVRATGEDLAEVMGLTRRTVQRISYNLRIKGIITMRLDGSTNLYRLVRAL